MRTVCTHSRTFFPGSVGLQHRLELPDAARQRRTEDAGNGQRHKRLRDRLDDPTGGGPPQPFPAPFAYCPQTMFSTQ